MDTNALDQDARWRRFSAKRRVGELLESMARGDAEGVLNAARMVSGTLGPEGLRGASQFQMRNLITSVAPQYVILTDTIKQVSGTHPAVAVSDALSRLAAFESSAGRVHIWVQRPKLATCEALVRAAQNREQDFPDYLAWLRGVELGLLGSELDAFLAMVILGMRSERGELVLPGDMLVKRRRRVVLNLGDVPEPEVLPKLLEWAEQRKKYHGRADGKQRHRDQLSQIDRTRLEAEDAAAWGRFRWTAGVKVDWEAIANQLDPRTAEELRMTLDGCSVDEIGKVNYEHLRRKLPAIRKLIIDDGLHKNVVKVR